jgi:CO/xanthine dehydrogenase FAD-binding subunit
MLVRMAKDVGAVQIQARGTLGGNLATASPAADGVAALAAYDATIVVKSARGERRIAMADLQTGYKKSTRAADEIIVAVELALPPAGSPWYWRKVGARRAQAISKVALAGIAVVENGTATRFGVGMVSVGPVTALMATTRALVLGKAIEAITTEEIDHAVDPDVTPIDDVRSTGEYRAHVARVLTRDLLRQLGARV